MRVALLTCLELPDLISDDAPLLEELRRQKIDFEIKIWNQTPIDQFEHFDFVIVRSTWDYHWQASLFLLTLKQISLRSRLLNSADLIAWNIDKSYLLDLSAQGLAIPETIKVKSTSEIPWSSFVLKPAISASAYLTAAFSSNQQQEAKSHLNKILKEGSALAQKFQSSVSTLGEVSTVFFNISGNPTYSHSVLKKPKPGDFRVQTDWGGSVEAYKASNELIEAAKAVLQKLKSKWLYARVDMFFDKDNFLLSELEMIEPQLFFKSSPSSAALFVKALKSLA